MFLATIKSIAEAAKETMHFMRLRQEIKLKRQLLDEQERVEDENRKLEHEINVARDDGDYGLADWLLERQTQRLIYSAGIYNITKRSDLYRSAPDGTGNGSGGTKERSADH